MTFFPPTQETLLWRKIVALHVTIHHKLGLLLHLDGQDLMDNICDLDEYVDDVHQYTLLKGMDRDIGHLRVDVVCAVCSALQRHTPRDDEEQNYIQAWLDEYNNLDRLLRD
jgi:hypothetical protein